MDVKFINPFVQGTMEAMKKIAFMDIRPGKVHLTESNVAAGDVSGIIGITGDATGSLVISFTETCLCSIVGGLTGEPHIAVDEKAFAVVREISRIILVVAGAYLEKEGLKVYAAPPIVVYGKAHTIESLPDNPSITIPFSTEKEAFKVDICIKPRAAKTSPAQAERAAKIRLPDPAIPAPVTEVQPVAGKVLSEEERKALIMIQLNETKTTRDELQKQLSGQPFMEMSQRLKIKKAVPILEAKIKRLKLDLAALEMIAKMGSGEEKSIAPHYQHYSNEKKR